MSCPVKIIINILPNTVEIIRELSGIRFVIVLQIMPYWLSRQKPEANNQRNQLKAILIESKVLNQQKKRKRKSYLFMRLRSVLVRLYSIYCVFALRYCCDYCWPARLGFLPKIANDGDDIRFASEAALGPEMRIQYNKNYWVVSNSLILVVVVAVVN